jgi:hypothetical protein
MHTQRNMIHTKTTRNTWLSFRIPTWFHSFKGKHRSFKQDSSSLLFPYDANEVWGNLDPEQQELADLEDSIRVFFIKHKAVRQVTLAPKHWIKLFPSKELGRWFNLLFLYDHSMYWQKLKIFQHNKDLYLCPAPRFWFRLTIDPCV